MRKLLQSLLTPYRYGNVEIDEWWISNMHKSISQQRSVKSLLTMREHISDNITYQVSGRTRESLIRLYEYADYRIKLILGV